MLTDEQKADLRAKHTRTCEIAVGDIEIVLRAPTRSEYRACRAQSHDRAKQADAQEDLVRRIVVYPDRKDFDAILDMYPGICENPEVSRRIAVWTGMQSGADDDAK